MRVARLLAVLLLLVAAPARAQTFVVDTTADAVDLDPGDGICDVDPTSAEICALRAAVMEANALGGGVIELPPGLYRLILPGIESAGQAGDLDVYVPISILGSGVGVTTIEQTYGDRVLHVWNGGELHLDNLTVSGGHAGAIGGSDLGGAIRNLGTVQLTDVELTGNHAAIGGAIFNVGHVSATRVHVWGNTAEQHAGGIASASTSASGGAGTTLILTDSTIGPNTAPGVAELELANAASATLVNVTIAPADPSSLSLSIGNQEVVLAHVTMRGWMYAFSFHGDDPLTFVNSAIERCEFGSGPFPITRAGVNASSDASCGFAAAGGIEGDLKLGALADHGGPMPTLLPAAGSPLIDAASDAECPSHDQRGVVRPQDGDGVGGARCDIGAVEVRPEEVPEPGALAAWLAALGALSALARGRRTARGAGGPPGRGGRGIRQGP